MSSPNDPYVFQFGPLAVRWYGLLVVAGVLVAVYVAKLEAGRQGENTDRVWDLAVWSVIFGLIGARLYHVLSMPVGASRDFHYYFVEQPFHILKIFGIAIPFPTALLIWEGGVGILGAIVGSVGAVFVYSRRHGLNTWRWLDIIAPGALLAQAIGRWGNFFNQELYGTPTDLPWGITITNVNQRIPPYDNLTLYTLDTMFHPVFLYESLWNIIGFVLLMWVGRRYASKLMKGDIFALYLIWYPLGRLFVEWLRPDAWTIFGMPVAQVVSAILISMAVILLTYQRKMKQLPHTEKQFRVYR